MSIKPEVQKKIPNDEFTKRFIDELNKCRKNPQGYSSKIRSFEQYFDKEVLRIPNETAIKTKEGYSAFEEAAMFLDNLDEVGSLEYSEGFSYAALDALKHIQEYKILEEVGQLKIDECLSKFGEVYGPFAQCVDFGTANPELLVVLLLADDGDENRANRLSILNHNFRVIGFAHGTHEIHSDCSVVMLGMNFYSLNEKPSEDDIEGEEEDLKEKQNLDEDKMYFEKKLGKKYIKLEREIQGKNGKKVKLIKEMSIKNGILYTDIYKEKI
jgi:hypothetical protein